VPARRPGRNAWLSDVIHAPSFRDVAGDIAGRLADAVVVGHQLRFDLSFLAAEFTRLGATLPCAVVVTAGAAGAYVASDGTLQHVPAPACVPLDTTGAGDAFVGALAVRLRAGDELGAAAAFAVRAATLSVTRPGTMPAYPTAAELS